MASFKFFLGNALLIFNFWQPSALAFDFSNITRVSNATGEEMNFDYKFSYDFNEDGVDDQVICTTAHYIKIVDGKKRSNIIYSWEGPEKTRVTAGGETHRRTLSGCEIIEMPNIGPIVVISNYWTTPVWRANAAQYIVFKRGSRYVNQLVSVNGFGTYFGVSRSVKCAGYPQRLVDLGYKSGALCFFSDYTAAGESHSALLKLEVSSDKSSIVAKDLTGTSGLMWSNGVRGTSIWGFPVGRGFASNQRDGAFMMDSAFLNFNDDSLIDFMTIGQHASIRAHRMAVDTDRREGVRFITESLTSADKYSDPTELLRSNTLNRMDPRININCVYISGENEGSNERDHIRCFKNGRWVTYYLPLDFNSEMYNAKARVNVHGNLIIKTRKINTDGSFVDLTFRVEP